MVTWSISSRESVAIVGDLVARVGKTPRQWGWWVDRDFRLLAMGRAPSRSAAKLRAGKVAEALASW